MATLSANITATQRNIRVTDGAAVTPSLRVRVDDELMDFIRFEPYPYINGLRQKGLDPTRWVVTRGVGNSVAASHLAAATVTAAIPAAVSSESLTPPDPFADATGGGGVTVDNQVDAPAAVTTLIAPGATIAGDEATLDSFSGGTLAEPLRIQTADADALQVLGAEQGDFATLVAIQAAQTGVPDSYLDVLVISSDGNFNFNIREEGSTFNVSQIDGGAAVAGPVIRADAYSVDITAGDGVKTLNIDREIAGGGLGFFGTAPVAQPAAVADATDPASTMARLNDLLARIRALGLIDT